jgi:hypothetical protein
MAAAAEYLSGYSGLTILVLASQRGNKPSLSGTFFRRSLI